MIEWTASGAGDARSRWRRTRAHAPPSSTIAATTRSRSIRSSGLFFNSREDTHPNLAVPQTLESKLCFERRFREANGDPLSRLRCLKNVEFRDNN